MTTEAKNKQFTMRASQEQYAAYEVEAEAWGVSVPEWLRLQADAAIHAPAYPIIEFAAEVFGWGDQYHPGDPIPYELSRDRRRLEAMFKRNKVRVAWSKGYVGVVLEDEEED